MRWIIGTIVLVGCGCSAEDDDSARATIGPEAIESAIEAASHYRTVGELEKGEAVLAVLVDRAPDLLEAHEMLGQIVALQADQARMAGDSAGARALILESYEQYRQATECPGGNTAGLHHSAGVVASTAGQVDAALHHFAVAAGLEPDHGQYALFAAQTLISASRYDEAEIQLQRVLALDADEAYAHASLAIIALETGRLDDAVRAIGEARAIEPSKTAFRVQAARIHRIAGNPERGLELLIGFDAAALVAGTDSTNPDGRGIDQKPDSVDDGLTFELAECHRALGDHRRAARTWERAFARSSGSRAADHAIQAAAAWLDAGEINEARSWLEAARVRGASADETTLLETRLNEATRP